MFDTGLMYYFILIYAKITRDGGALFQGGGGGAHARKQRSSKTLLENKEVILEK